MSEDLSIERLKISLPFIYLVVCTFLTLQYLHPPWELVEYVIAWLVGLAAFSITYYIV